MYLFHSWILRVYIAKRTQTHIFFLVLEETRNEKNLVFWLLIQNKYYPHEHKAKEWLTIWYITWIWVEHEIVSLSQMKYRSLLHISPFFAVPTSTSRMRETEHFYFYIIQGLASLHSSDFYYEMKSVVLIHQSVWNAD